MPDVHYFLTEHDRQEIKELLGWKESFRKNVGRPRLLEDDPTAPASHVILTPSGGIPARVGAAPGWADCDLYLITDRDTDSPVVDGTAADTVRAFNLSTTALPGGTYLPATRDKYGSWLAGTPPATGSGSTVTGSMVNKVAGTTTALTPTGTWVDVLSTPSLPSGTYFFSYNISGLIFSTVVNNHLLSRLLYVTIPDNAHQMIVEQKVGSVPLYGSVSGVAFVAFGGGVVKLQAARFGTGTWANSDVITLNPGLTQPLDVNLCYLQVA